MDTIWKQTVLVIGNDEPVVNLLFEWLVEEYRVRTVTTDEDVLKQIDASIDAVLILEGRPDIPSEAIADQVARLEPEPAVIIITGNELGEQSFNLSFKDSIQKPIREQELKEQVARLVRQRSYDVLIQELYSIARKRAVVEQAAHQKSGMMVDFDTILQAKQSQIEEQLDAVVTQFDAMDYRRSLQMLDAGGQS